MNENTNLNGKVAYITGGSKGIGRAIAEIMISAGMKVAITSRRLEAAQKVADELNAQVEDSALAIESDVRSLESEQKGIQKTLDKWGQLDVLIANAGVGHFAPIEQLTPKQWGEVIDINLTGVFNSVKASVEAIKASKGYIMTIASLAGTNFFANGAAYNASKFGLVGFTQAIMLDLRQYGVKVTTIMPGSVSTEFNNRTPSAADAWKIQPEDLGEIVKDLLQMHPRTLPSKVEVRPSMPPKR